VAAPLGALHRALGHASVADALTDAAVQSNRNAQLLPWVDLAQAGLQPTSGTHFPN
jgi:hypothetical protein